jgi:methylmalonyl-CoA mutase
MNEKKNDKYKCIGLIRHRTSRFFENQGRRPRILITRIHPMSPDREVKIIAAAFADMGFDVDINTSAQSPIDIARLAMENDVHVVGIPGISADKQTLISKLITALNAESGKKILLAIWTHHQPDDTVRVFKARNDKIEIFKFDTDATDFAKQILDVLEQPP